MEYSIFVEALPSILAFFGINNNCSSLPASHRLAFAASRFRYISGPAELKPRVSSSGKIVLQRVREAFQPTYRLATRDEAQAAKQDVEEVMPAWEIAYVADGWVNGVLYGSNSGYTQSCLGGSECLHQQAHCSSDEQLIQLVLFERAWLWNQQGLEKSAECMSSTAASVSISICPLERAIC